MPPAEETHDYLAIEPLEGFVYMASTGLAIKIEEDNNFYLVKPLASTPERKLLAAMFERAVYDLYSQERWTFKQAWDWFYSDSTEPFSLLWLLEEMHLLPQLEAIRRGVVKLANKRNNPPADQRNLQLVWDRVREEGMKQHGRRYLHRNRSRR